MAAINWTQIFTAIGKFLSDNEAILSILGLAFVVTMRESLPAPFDRWPICTWCYGWFHDAMKTFVSLRGPAANPVQPPPGGSISTRKIEESHVETPALPKDPSQPVEPIVSEQRITEVEVEGPTKENIQ